MLRAFTILGAGAVAALVLGFALEPAGFLGNVLAEGVGFAAGSLVTYLIIERVVAGERRLRVQPVREATFGILRRHVTEIALQYTSVYPALSHLIGTSTEGFTEHADGQVEYMNSVISEGREAANTEHRQRWDERGHLGPNHFAMELHDKRLKMEISGILDRAYPRVLEIGDMPEVAAALAALERAEVEWRVQILIERDVVAGNPYGASLDFLERARDVYVALHQEERRRQ